MLFRSWV